MSDPSFEARLERLFAQAPRVSDATAFAARVEARLDREWSLRRGFIGTAGLVGGVIAVTQTVGADMYGRFGETLRPLGARLSSQLSSDWYADLQAQSALSGEMVWVLVALGGLAATLVVTRVADSF